MLDAVRGGVVTVLIRIIIAVRNFCGANTMQKTSVGTLLDQNAGAQHKRGCFGVGKGDHGAHLCYESLHLQLVREPRDSALLAWVTSPCAWGVWSQVLVSARVQPAA